MHRYTLIVIVLTLCAGCGMLPSMSGKPNAGARARITGANPYATSQTTANADVTPAAAKQAPSDAKADAKTAAAANRPVDTGDRRSTLTEQGASIDQFTARGARDTATRARQASDTGYRRDIHDNTLWWVLGIAAALVVCAMLIFGARRRRRREADDDRTAEYETHRRVETRETRRPENRPADRISARAAAREMRV